MRRTNTRLDHWRPEQPINHRRLAHVWLAHHTQRHVAAQRTRGVRMPRGAVVRRQLLGCPAGAELQRGGSARFVVGSLGRCCACCLRRDRIGGPPEVSECARHAVASHRQRLDGFHQRLHVVAHGLVSAAPAVEARLSRAASAFEPLGRRAWVRAKRDHSGEAREALLQVRGPSGDHSGRQQVRLVQHNHHGRAASRFVLVQRRREGQEWRSDVHDEQERVRHLAGSPQLSPDLQVALVAAERLASVRRVQLRGPRGKSSNLARVQRLGPVLVRPLRPQRHGYGRLQLRRPRQQQRLLRRGRELHRPRGVCSPLLHLLLVLALQHRLQPRLPVGAARRRAARLRGALVRVVLLPLALRLALRLQQRRLLLAAERARRRHGGALDALDSAREVWLLGHRSTFARPLPSQCLQQSSHEQRSGCRRLCACMRRRARLRRPLHRRPRRSVGCSRTSVRTARHTRRGDAC